MTQFGLMSRSIVLRNTFHAAVRCFRLVVSVQSSSLLNSSYLSVLLLHVSNTQQQTGHPAVSFTFLFRDSSSHTDPLGCSRRLLVTFFVFLPELLKSCFCQHWCSLGRDERPVLLLIMHDLLPVCLHLPLHPALRCLSHSIIIFTEWKSHYILTATVEGFRAAAGQV